MKFNKLIEKIKTSHFFKFSECWNAIVAEKLIETNAETMEQVINCVINNQKYQVKTTYVIKKVI